MEIHIWNCYETSKISVDINKNLKDKIKEEIKDNLYKTANEIGVIPARLYDYFIYQTTPIPLNILLKFSKIIDIPLEEIEKEVILCKQLHVPSKNSIKTPKLPIKINPYLTSIVSNLFFDGSMPKDGKGTYYNQKNEQIMNDFIERVKYVFGDISYSLKLDHRGVLKCRVPRIMGEICKHIYKVDSFGTFNSRIPKKIFNLNKEHKIAFILTAIIDEGSITYDGSIQFSISNKNMLTDFRLLCNEIDLKTTQIKYNKNFNHYYLYIKSIKKFQNLVNKFRKKYPLISLRCKGERLKKALEIKKQKFFYTKDFADKRKSLILNELNKKENSINYLAVKFLIPPRTIRRYMYRLIKENKLSRKKISNEYIYFVPH